MAQIVRSIGVCILCLAAGATFPARAVEPSQSPASSIDQQDSGGGDDQQSSQTQPQVVVTGHSLQEKNAELDAARDRNLLPKLGATDYSIDQQDLQTLPQGKNTPLDKVVLQIPGVSYRFGDQQSRLSRSQRVRERAVPNQRHSAPGWRVGARSGLGPTLSPA